MLVKCYNKQIKQKVDNKTKRISGPDFNERRGGFYSSALDEVLAKCRVILKWFIQNVFTDHRLHI